MTTLTYPLPLQRITDAEQMRAVFDELIGLRWPEAKLRSIHIPRVIPKKSGEIVIQYELLYHPLNESCFAPRMLYAQYLPLGLKDSPDASRQSVWIKDLRLLIWLFPGDPELDHLGLLCDPERFHAAYDVDLENVGYSHMAMGTPAEVLGYRLGRRCVARVSWQDRVKGLSPQFPKNDIVIKMARKRQTLALWTRWRQLEHEGFSHNSSDGIGMPKSLFLHSDTGALFQDFAHETSIHELIGSERFASHCERASLTLAKLHQCRISGLVPYSMAEELSQLRWLTDITGQAFSSVALNLSHKLDDLVTSAPTDDRRAYTTAHRDFYDKQVLSGDSRTVLLDCDTLALADPALDYGNFIAHLFWRAQQHSEHAASIVEGITRFRAAYTNDSIEFQNRASWWTRAALLRLACIYTWRPRWHNYGITLADIDHGHLCNS